ncbi:Cytochrome P450 [Micromonospora sediminicola]|uniref:Cytochrome P450 n=1 Tax=Micromonospora sediminicola TaxID=946078 RepID=A0A1A9B9Z6_9ACTN|nr:cytochrome P450 [Micromonospora sediminicola]SBT65722.1 Cytochrome P450 [Micromonospora sediminicola]
MTAPAPIVDLTDVEAFAAGAHREMFRWLRATDPVHAHVFPDGGRFWALTRYRDVVAAYTDHRTFSSSGGAMLGGSFRSREDTAAGRMLVASDPPRHRLLRKVMHHAFSPERIRLVQRQVELLVDAAVDRLLADGGGDFATDVAPELPAGALMAMVGLSQDEAHELIGMTRRMIGFRDPVLVEQTSDVRLQLAGIQADIFDFFEEVIRLRRHRPGDDLVSLLLTATINGRPLPEEEVLYNCMNVAVGGNETSSYTACSGLLALLDHPDQSSILLRDPELLDCAIGEMLRWSSTNAYVQRVAVRDTEIGGRHIRSGDSVTLWNVSANFDEDQFDEPNVFRVTRTPNRHLTYGVGIHRCIGATLAHVELGTLFARILPHLPRMQQAGEARRLRSNFILGTTSMPIVMI